MSDARPLLNVYDNRNQLCSALDVDRRFETIRTIRKQLTELEFQLMEPQICEECIAMQGVHIVVAIVNGLELKDYCDGAIIR